MRRSTHATPPLGPVGVSSRFITRLRLREHLLSCKKGFEPRHARGRVNIQLNRQERIVARARNSNRDVPRLVKGSKGRLTPGSERKHLTRGREGGQADFVLETTAKNKSTVIITRVRFSEPPEGYFSRMLVIKCQRTDTPTTAADTLL
jgi:hypothetical protein